jgi:hypothetical protein
LQKLIDFKSGAGPQGGDEGEGYEETWVSSHYIVQLHSVHDDFLVLVSFGRVILIKM